MELATMKSIFFFGLSLCLLLFGCDPINLLLVENQTQQTVHLQGILQVDRGFDSTLLSNQNMSTASLSSDTLPSGEISIEYDLLPGQSFPLGEQIGLTPGSDFKSLHLRWANPTPSPGDPIEEIRLFNEDELLAAAVKTDSYHWVVPIQ